MGLAIHNYGIQEYMQHSDKTNEVFEQSMTFVDGYLHPGDKPGIGVEFNEEEAGSVPLPAGLPALQPPRRRHRPRLVSALMPHRIIVMGVSGCGKTTIGDLVARELGVPFLDGDALHPVENVAKMAPARR